MNIIRAGYAVGRDAETSVVWVDQAICIRLALAVEASRINGGARWDERRRQERWR